ncbi:MAG TPA: tripartite tricarboxylate transporter permease [Candidatus Thermoplasmatota archaeon]|nr:tripartite tricarboxylate transporter permease [Candidatus Thermoplasmatota archaeon]
MDLALLTVALAGALAGVVASALPGVHVNLLAVALLAFAPDAGSAGALFLVAALAASPFGLALSATFLGGPADDAALSSLPAHELAREGRAREAVALQAWGALLGILAALPLAFLVRLALPRVPLAAWTPWLLVAVVALLVWSETACLRWPRARHWTELDEREGSRWLGRLAALGVLLLAGALGLAAFRLGARSPFGWPTSALLPLLAGLFALPSLVLSLRARPRAGRDVLRAPRAHLRPLWRAAWPGAAASATLGLLPGVSPSHAALLAPRPRKPEEALVRIAAVNGGAVVFTLLAWHALAKARSGALVAAGSLARVPPWPTWRPPPAVLEEAALVVAAALAGLLLARALSGALARAPPRPLAWGGLALVLAAVAAFNGAFGVAVLAAAALVGALPVRLGVRRSHLMGAILVPATLRAWAVA